MCYIQEDIWIHVTGLFFSWVLDLIRVIETIDIQHHNVYSSIFQQSNSINTYYKQSKVSEVIASASDSTMFFTNSSEVAASISPVASPICGHYMWVQVQAIPGSHGLLPFAVKFHETHVIV